MCNWKQPTAVKNSLKKSHDYIFQINSKYSEELAAEALEWVKEITNEPINTSGDMDNFFEVLKDGVILCKLANAIQVGSVKRINESKMGEFF